jgi:hypothetical protein
MDIEEPFFEGKLSFLCGAVDRLLLVLKHSQIGDKKT